jgi:Na+/alanine symporter
MNNIFVDYVFITHLDPIKAVAFKFLLLKFSYCYTILIIILVNIQDIPNIAMKILQVNLNL